MQPLIGHRWAMDLLSRQLARDRVAHAYLFTGPPQVGKGTLSRWFAQALLCQAEEGAPCGTCGSCQKAAAGIHPDLRTLNLDVQPGGRRTLGIEAVRQVRAGMAERPFAGRRKVYLIEDAEAMTTEAANALLKTLEEPPPFVVLLLAALTEAMLPPTIVSRCQLVPLRPVSRAEVRQALLQRGGVEEERADLLAALSYGQPGWAVQAVEDPALLQRREADLGALVRLMGAGLLDRFAFAEAQEREWKRGEHGAVLALLERWQGWWRDLLLMATGCDDLVVNQDGRGALQATARQVSPQAAFRFMQALRSAQQYLQEQVNPRLVFEDLLLRLPAVVV